MRDPFILNTGSIYVGLKSWWTGAELLVVRGGVMSAAQTSSYEIYLQLYLSVLFEMVVPPEFFFFIFPVPPFFFLAFLHLPLTIIYKRMMLTFLTMLDQILSGRANVCFVSQILQPLSSSRYSGLTALLSTSWL